MVVATCVFGNGSRSPTPRTLTLPSWQTASAPQQPRRWLSSRGRLAAPGYPSAVRRPPMRPPVAPCSRRNSATGVAMTDLLRTAHLSVRDASGVLGVSRSVVHRAGCPGNLPTRLMIYSGIRAARPPTSASRNHVFVRQAARAEPRQFRSSPSLLASASPSAQRSARPPLTARRGRPVRRVIAAAA